MPFEEEVILPFAGSREHPPFARSVRGTVLATSHRAMRARGLYDAYLAQTDPAYRDRLTNIVPSSWIPIDVGIAHYEACERMRLDRALIVEIGGESGRLLNQTVLSTVFKLSREAGLSPWSALPYGDKLIARTWEGSTGGVFKVGPKEARFEWLGQPVAAVPYFKIAFGGFIQGILGLFASVVHVREIPRLCTETTLAYRCSWV